MESEAKTAAKPGFLERFSYVSRNIEAVAATIAAMLGHAGAAALLGLGAIFDHAAGEHFKNRRLKPQSA